MPSAASAFGAGARSEPLPGRPLRALPTTEDRSRRSRADVEELAVFDGVADEAVALGEGGSELSGCSHDDVDREGSWIDQSGDRTIAIDGGQVGLKHH